MTAERESEVSLRRYWRNPGWCLVAMACLLDLHSALARDEAPASASEPLEHLTLVAPSHPGGGWDSTAQAMKQVLEAEGIVRSVEIEHVPGHGGLIGLSNFVGSRRADGHSLLIGGMLMVGAAVSKHALSALDELTPIAQVTSDADVVVVPASSPYHNLDDLLAAMRSNPEAIRWVGGSVGGSDHPTMWLLARAAGVAPELMRYESFPSASEVATQLASGRFSVGIDGYREFERFIRSGKLRGLAVVSRQPIEGVSIPTFQQLGILGTSISNWFGAFAPAAVSDGDKVRLEAAIQQMVQSPQWLAALKPYHLRSTYLDAADFSQLVAEERTRISKSEAITGVAPLHASAEPPEASAAVAAGACWRDRRALHRSVLAEARRPPARGKSGTGAGGALAGSRAPDPGGVAAEPGRGGRACWNVYADRARVRSVGIDVRGAQCGASDAEGTAPKGHRRGA